MRTVTCKELGSVTAISVGTTYNVIDESGSRYTIINDKGVQANYGKNLFHNPVEVREEPVAPAPAARRGRPARVQPPVAVAAPIRVVDEISIETSAINNDGQISFASKFDFGGGQIFEWGSGVRMTSSGVSASCGIQSLSGINDLSIALLELRSNFESYVRQNAGSFTLSQDISLDSIFSSVSQAIVQDLIASFQGEDADVEAALLLISTGVDHLDTLPSLRFALDTIAVANTPAIVNPNSGNSILSWMLPVTEA